MSWLIHATEISIVFLNSLALLMVVAGSLEAVVGIIRLLKESSRSERREVWLRYARWLVAALTFASGLVVAVRMRETHRTASYQPVIQPQER